MTDALKSYLDQSTAILKQFEPHLNEKKEFVVEYNYFVHMLDILRIGRGIMTQQAWETDRLKNELAVKTDTLKQMLSRRPIMIDKPKEPA